MVNAFNDPVWEKAYVRQTLPEFLSDIADGTKAAFNADVLGVTGTIPQANNFNGINYAGTLYLNLDAERDYCN